MRAIIGFVCAMVGVWIAAQDGFTWWSWILGFVAVVICGPPTIRELIEYRDYRRATFERQEGDL